MKNNTGMSTKSNKAIGFSNIRSVVGSVNDINVAFGINSRERGQGIAEFLVIAVLVIIVVAVIVLLLTSYLGSGAQGAVDALGNMINDPAAYAKAVGGK